MKRILEENFASIKGMLADLVELGMKGMDFSEESLAILSAWEKGEEPQHFNALCEEIAQCDFCNSSAISRGKLLAPPSGKIRMLVLDFMPERSVIAEHLAMSGGAEALLRKIIQAMGLSNDDVYISHCLMCRMQEPDFRNPVFPCRGFLKNLVSFFRPEVLCGLGERAGQFLTGKKEPLSNLRGVFFSYESIPLMITHHPSDMLIYPELKRETWDDVKKIMELLS